MFSSLWFCNIQIIWEKLGDLSTSSVEGTNAGYTQGSTATCMRKLIWQRQIKFYWYEYKKLITPTGTWAALQKDGLIFICMTHSPGSEGKQRSPFKMVIVSLRSHHNTSQMWWSIIALIWGNIVLYTVELEFQILSRQLKRFSNVN